jgi:hypothetical protein
MDAFDMKYTLRGYLLLDQEIERQIRYGRYPGEEALEERNELYNKLWKMAME